MQLDELYIYKNQLIGDLLTDVDILRLLHDDCVEDQDPEDFVYKQVFPYEYIPDTVEHGQTFICCDVDVQKSLNKTFLLPVLYVWVFSHKSKQRLPGGGLRVDQLVSRIASRVNGSRCYGLGELDLYSVKRFAPINDYMGKVMMFQTLEYNRPGRSEFKVPSNRRSGSADT